MSKLTRLPEPGAGVFARPWGYTVYCWTHALPDGTPLRLFVSIHTFHWAASRAARRWARAAAREDTHLRERAVLVKAGRRS